MRKQVLASENKVIATMMMNGLNTNSVATDNRMKTGLVSSKITHYSSIHGA